MQFGSTPSPRVHRLGPVALVAALHAVLIYGIASGLVQQALKAPAPPPKVEMLKEEPKPPVEQPKVVVADAAPTRPDMISVPLPPLPPISEESPIRVQATTEPVGTVDLTARSSETLPGAMAGTGATGVSAAASTPVAAGLLCQVMAKPEVPTNLNDGVARVRALGTVRGGRVVAVELQVLQALSDRRVQRALLGSLEQTLRNGYQCSSDGVFSQEFVFRLE